MTVMDPVDAIADALLDGALPGETDGFDAAARHAAAEFIFQTAADRQPSTPAIALDSIGGEGTRRRMRLVVVNDDMPFLVDSIAAALGSRQIDIHRLLHPVVSVSRDKGRLTAVASSEAGGGARESMIYMEVERADARVRRALEVDLPEILADVRVAVADWSKLREALTADAATMPEGEGATLLRWFLERHFTLLGHHVERTDGSVDKAALGILSRKGEPLWSKTARESAFRRLDEGGDAPLILKADRLATVHRRAALDMLVVPRREGGQVTALSIYVGLWTSAALREEPENVPVLRARLAALEAKHGFEAGAHAGKALRHALSALPHDLLISFDADGLEEVALTAMSLADRPRPKLVLVPGPLRRQLFAFVWMPREAISIARRQAIAEMLERAVEGRVLNWALELGEGELGMLRYTLDLAEGTALPDSAPLDTAIEAMLRGWSAAVEANLAEEINPARATRLTLIWAEAFPASYRAAYGASEAARDVLRLTALETAADRGATLYRSASDGSMQLRLKTYRLGGLIPLSEAVPVIENFGFRVLEQVPTALGDGNLGYIHDFLLELEDAATLDALVPHGEAIETAIARALEGRAENDAFNALMTSVGLDARAVTLLRALFRYLRQTGLPFGLATVVDALRHAPDVARGLLALFDARHDAINGGGEEAAAAAVVAIDTGLTKVAAIDDDRILRLFRSVVSATLRTNAFTAAANEALAFKLDSAAIPGLPKPLPWREIWVYSPRVEGIHLRGGPIARGGLRWSDRRDDFRTEILGLMKAQVVKNAVIVPTGAKGGFYAKQLPSPADRDAWLAEGTESYRIFIRALLSVTDNLVEGQLVHPAGVQIHDGDDPYFVVAADKGTATFSDIANAIAIERGFWLGDAFASGGSVGYDHKAMGITARGAWVSVRRHFAEMGVDVQTQPVTVVGCGDMSGDVFGNGMLLSKALKLVAAFDHRHIFFDPSPDLAASYEERARLFALTRSSWADYDAKLISKGGGVFPRTQKAIPLSAEVKALLNVTADSLDPASIIAAILKAPADLLWFGGIGTYVKARAQNNAEVGDPANDANRVDGEDLRVKVVGEGANLGITQAGRIVFAQAGGRINTDFIDNSAGVDCSDNEVNIKIALNREMTEGRLENDDRVALLARMTDDVSALVLEDNRLQTLALSLAERGGAAALPSQLRVVETLEAAGRMDRAVDGLESNALLLRRIQDNRGLTRPELAVLLSHAKLALQQSIENGNVAFPGAYPELLHNAFPQEMQRNFPSAIDTHRLAPQIIATKMANRVVNRLGLAAPFELAEEAGIPLARVAAGYFAVDRLFELESLWTAIEQANVTEDARLTLFDATATLARPLVADLLRATPADMAPADAAECYRPGVMRLRNTPQQNTRGGSLAQTDLLRVRLAAAGADTQLIDRIIDLQEMEGAIGTAALAARMGLDEGAANAAYNRLGEALGLDWATAATLRFTSSDPWERLLASGLLRDFEQLRLDFLAKVEAGRDPVAEVEAWLAEHEARVSQFRRLVDRVGAEASLTVAMLAQLAGQARVLLGTSRR